MEQGHVLSKKPKAITDIEGYRNEDDDDDDEGHRNDDYVDDNDDNNYLRLIWKEA